MTKTNKFSKNMEPSNPYRLLFQAKLSNKEVVFKKLPNEQLAQQFIFKTRLNLLLIIVSLLLMAFYRLLPIAGLKEEIVSRQQLGDFTYNWGLPLRNYIWQMTVDVFVMGVVFGYLFLFGKNRHDWLEIMNLFEDKIVRFKVGIEAKNQLWKKAAFAFQVSDWILRFFLISIVTHVFGFATIMIIDYKIPELSVFVKRMPLLLTLVPFQFYNTYALFRLSHFLVAPFCYFFITTQFIDHSFSKLNLFSKVILRNKHFLKNSKSDKIIAYLVAFHTKSIAVSKTLIDSGANSTGHSMSVFCFITSQ